MSHPTTPRMPEPLRQALRQTNARAARLARMVIEGQRPMAGQPSTSGKSFGREGRKQQERPDEREQNVWPSWCFKARR